MSAAKSKHKAVRRFVAAVRADYASVQKNREKYHNEKLSAWRMPIAARLGSELAHHNGAGHTRRIEPCKNIRDMRQTVAKKSRYTVATTEPRTQR